MFFNSSPFGGDHGAGDSSEPIVQISEVLACGEDIARRLYHEYLSVEVACEKYLANPGRFERMQATAAGRNGGTTGSSSGRALPSAAPVERANRRQHMAGHTSNGAARNDNKTSLGGHRGDHGADQLKQHATELSQKIVALLKNQEGAATTLSTSSSSSAAGGQPKGAADVEAQVRELLLSTAAVSSVLSAAGAANGDEPRTVEELFGKHPNRRHMGCVQCKRFLGAKEGYYFGTKAYDIPSFPRIDGSGRAVTAENKQTVTLTGYHRDMKPLMRGVRSRRRAALNNRYRIAQAPSVENDYGRHSTSVAPRMSQMGWRWDDNDAAAHIIHQQVQHQCSLSTSTTVNGSREENDSRNSGHRLGYDLQDVDEISESMDEHERDEDAGETLDMRLNELMKTPQLMHDHRGRAAYLRTAAPTLLSLADLDPELPRREGSKQDHATKSSTSSTKKVNTSTTTTSTACFTNNDLVDAIPLLQVVRRIFWLSGHSNEFREGMQKWVRAITPDTASDSARKPADQPDNEPSALVSPAVERLVNDKELPEQVGQGAVERVEKIISTIAQDRPSNTLDTFHEVMRVILPALLGDGENRSGSAPQDGAAGRDPGNISNSASTGGDIFPSMMDVDSDRQPGASSLPLSGPHVSEGGNNQPPGRNTNKNKDWRFLDLPPEIWRTLLHEEKPWCRTEAMSRMTADPFIVRTHCAGGDKSSAQESLRVSESVSASVLQWRYGNDSSSSVEQNVEQLPAREDYEMTGLDTSEASAGKKKMVMKKDAVSSSTASKAMKTAPKSKARAKGAAAKSVQTRKVSNKRKAIGVSEHDAEAEKAGEGRDELLDDEEPPFSSKIDGPKLPASNGKSVAELALSKAREASTGSSALATPHFEHAQNTGALPLKPHDATYLAACDLVFYSALPCQSKLDYQHLHSTRRGRYVAPGGAAEAVSDYVPAEQADRARLASLGPLGGGNLEVRAEKLPAEQALQQLVLQLNQKAGKLARGPGKYGNTLLLTLDHEIRAFCSRKLLSKVRNRFIAIATEKLLAFMRTTQKSQGIAAAFTAQANKLRRSSSTKKNNFKNFASEDKSCCSSRRPQDQEQDDEGNAEQSPGGEQHQGHEDMEIEEDMSEDDEDRLLFDDEDEEVEEQGQVRRTTGQAGSSAKNYVKPINRAAATRAARAWDHSLANRLVRLLLASVEERGDFESWILQTDLVNSLTLEICVKHLWVAVGETLAHDNDMGLPLASSAFDTQEDEAKKLLRALLAVLEVFALQFIDLQARVSTKLLDKELQDLVAQALPPEYEAHFEKAILQKKRRSRDEMIVAELFGERTGRPVAKRKHDALDLMLGGRDYETMEEELLEEHETSQIFMVRQRLNRSFPDTGMLWRMFDALGACGENAMYFAFVLLGGDPSTSTSTSERPTEKSSSLTAAQRAYLFVMQQSHQIRLCEGMEIALRESANAAIPPGGDMYHDDIGGSKIELRNASSDIAIDMTQHIANFLADFPAYVQVSDDTERGATSLQDREADRAEISSKQSQSHRHAGVIINKPLTLVQCLFDRLRSVKVLPPQAADSQHGNIIDTSSQESRSISIFGEARATEQDQISNTKMQTRERSYAEIEEQDPTVVIAAQEENLLERPLWCAYPESSKPPGANKAKKTSKKQEAASSKKAAGRDNKASPCTGVITSLGHASVFRPCTPDHIFGTLPLTRRHALAESHALTELRKQHAVEKAANTLLSEVLESGGAEGQQQGCGSAAQPQLTETIESHGNGTTLTSTTVPKDEKELAGTDAVVSGIVECLLKQKREATYGSTRPENATYFERRFPVDLAPLCSNFTDAGVSFSSSSSKNRGIDEEESVSSVYVTKMDKLARNDCFLVGQDKSDQTDVFNYLHALQLNARTQANAARHAGNHFGLLHGSRGTGRLGAFQYSDTIYDRDDPNLDDDIQHVEDDPWMTDQDADEDDNYRSRHLESSWRLNYGGGYYDDTRYPYASSSENELDKKPQEIRQFDEQHLRFWSDPHAIYLTESLRTKHCNFDSHCSPTMPPRIRIRGCDWYFSEDNKLAAPIQQQMKSGGRKTKGDNKINSTGVVGVNAEAGSLLGGSSSSAFAMRRVHEELGFGYNYNVENGLAGYAGAYHSGGKGASSTGQNSGVPAPILLRMVESHRNVLVPIFTGEMRIAHALWRMPCNATSEAKAETSQSQSKHALEQFVFNIKKTLPIKALTNGVDHKDEPTKKTGNKSQSMKAEKKNASDLQATTSTNGNLSSAVQEVEDEHHKAGDDGASSSALFGINGVALVSANLLDVILKGIDNSSLSPLERGSLTNTIECLPEDILAGTRRMETHKDFRLLQEHHYQLQVNVQLYQIFERFFTGRIRFPPAKLSGSVAVINRMRPSGYIAKVDEVARGHRNLLTTGKEKGASCSRTGKSAAPAATAGTAAMSSSRNRKKKPAPQGKNDIFTEADRARASSDAAGGSSGDKNVTSFEIMNNDNDPSAAMPPGWSQDHPLRPEQLRSLFWMQQRERVSSSSSPESGGVEAGSEAGAALEVIYKRHLAAKHAWRHDIPKTEVNTNKGSFPETEQVRKCPLGNAKWCLEFEVTATYDNRGGILADKIGFGKTATCIGLLASQRAADRALLLRGASLAAVKSDPDTDFNRAQFVSSTSAFPLEKTEESIDLEGTVLDKTSACSDSAKNENGNKQKIDRKSNQNKTKVDAEDNLHVDEDSLCDEDEGVTHAAPAAKRRRASGSNEERKIVLEATNNATPTQIQKSSASAMKTSSSYSSGASGVLPLPMKRGRAAATASKLKTIFEEQQTEDGEEVEQNRSSFPSSDARGKKRQVLSFEQQCRLLQMNDVDRESLFPAPKTTLILVPSHLIDQWSTEIEKFLPKNDLKVLVCKNIAPLKQRTVYELQQFDVILVTYRVLYSPVHQSRLCSLSGAPGGDSRKKKEQSNDGDESTLHSANKSASGRGGAGNDAKNKEFLDSFDLPASTSSTAGLLLGARGNKGKRAAQAGSKQGRAAVEQHQDSVEQHANITTLRERTREFMQAMRQQQSCSRTSFSGSRKKKFEAWEIKAASKVKSDVLIEIPSINSDRGKDICVEQQQHATALNKNQLKNNKGGTSSGKHEATSTTKKRHQEEEAEVIWDVIEEKSSERLLLFPLLEQFYFRRIVFDEFHELEAFGDKQVSTLLSLKAYSKFGLTGTPQVDSVRQVAATASLFGVDLCGVSRTEADYADRLWRLACSNSENDLTKVMRKEDRHLYHNYDPYDGGRLEAQRAFQIAIATTYNYAEEQEGAHHEQGQTNTRPARLKPMSEWICNCCLEPAFEGTSDPRSLAMDPGKGGKESLSPSTKVDFICQHCGTHNHTPDLFINLNGSPEKERSGARDSASRRGGAPDRTTTTGGAATSSTGGLTAAGAASAPPFAGTSAPRGLFEELVGEADGEEDRRLGRILDAVDGIREADERRRQRQIFNRVRYDEYGYRRRDYSFNSSEGELSYSDDYDSFDDHVDDYFDAASSDSRSYGGASFSTPHRLEEDPLATPRGLRGSALRRFVQADPRMQYVKMLRQMNLAEEPEKYYRLVSKKAMARQRLDYLRLCHPWDRSKIFRQNCENFLRLFVRQNSAVTDADKIETKEHWIAVSHTAEERAIYLSQANSLNYTSSIASDATTASMMSTTPLPSSSSSSSAALGNNGAASSSSTSNAARPLVGGSARNGTMLCLPGGGWSNKLAIAGPAPLSASDLDKRARLLQLCSHFTLGDYNSHADTNSECSRIFDKKKAAVKVALKTFRATCRKLAVIMAVYRDDETQRKQAFKPALDLMEEVTRNYVPSTNASSSGPAMDVIMDEDDDVHVVKNLQQANDEATTAEGSTTTTTTTTTTTITTTSTAVTTAGAGKSNRSASASMKKTSMKTAASSSSKHAAAAASGAAAAALNKSGAANNKEQSDAAAKLDDDFCADFQKQILAMQRICEQTERVLSRETAMKAFSGQQSEGDHHQHDSSSAFSDHSFMSSSMRSAGDLEAWSRVLKFLFPTSAQLDRIEKERANLQNQNEAGTTGLPSSTTRGRGAGSTGASASANKKGTGKKDQQKNKDASTSDILAVCALAMYTATAKSQAARDGPSPASSKSSNNTNKTSSSQHGAYLRFVEPKEVVEKSHKSYPEYQATTLQMQHLTKVKDQILSLFMQDFNALREASNVFAFFKKTLKIFGKGSESPDDRKCVLCMEEDLPVSNLSITSCGHVFCVECIHQQMRANHNKCGLCRKPLRDKDIYSLALEMRSAGVKIDARSEQQKTDNLREELGGDKSFEIKYDNALIPEDIRDPEAYAEYGSKIQSICQVLLHIDREEPGAKVILFCQWKNLMCKIANCLTKYGFRYSTLTGGAVTQNKKLSEFKDPSGMVNVLLLSLETAAAGTNLAECCHHCLLVHPMNATTLDKAVSFELQAIGRIRRYGQKASAIHVWRFLTLGTVEEDVVREHGLAIKQREQSKRALLDSKKPRAVEFDSL
ncbi:unnamed protein product [Amoebophrya sp. A25]|nr:unnamed protein product [Amoebophrya sp. A25]|eukprot:GSA25T00007864001.1